MQSKHILGIDIGGSGIKGAIVNIKTGKQQTDRFRIPTPNPSTPEAVVEIIKAIAVNFAWKGCIGVGFPGVIQHGVVKTAANIDDGWLDVDFEKLMYQRTGSRCVVVNDADAAGMAEMKYGAGTGC